MQGRLDNKMYFLGNNIYEGNKLLLSLLWQMMRYYTLSLMKYGDSDKKLTEQEVIEWCNKSVPFILWAYYDIRR